MRKLLVFLLLIISLSVQAATYYVSTTGSNSNPGTITQPWLTWQYAMTRLTPGDILYVRGGTYTTSYDTYIGIRIKPSSGLGYDGTAGSHITVLNYPGETPVFNCSALTGNAEHDGFEMEGVDYWDITGLTVTNCKNRGSNEPSPGWTLQTCSNITINQCIVYNCDAGFITYSSDYVYYTNCDSYNNGLLALYKGNNGFYGDAAGGAHVYYDGCRAYWNGQDGWDSFNFQGAASGYIYYNRCWSWNNAKFHAGSGFKTGVTSAAAISAAPQRILTNCISAGQDGGYDESQDYGDDTGPPIWHGFSIPHLIYHCVSYANGTGFQYSEAGGYSGVEYIDIIRNNISYGDTHTTYNGTPSGFGNNTADNNSWDIKTVTSGDFQSVDTAQLSNPRQADGSLPIITAFHLASGSTLRNAGLYIAGYQTDADGNSFNNPPSVGAWEYGGAAPILITSLSVASAGNATTISTYHGTLQFSVTVTPSNATNQVIDWRVVNGTGSASISSTGLLTAITNGTIVVYAYATGDNSNKTAMSSVITLSNQVQSGYPTVITIIETNVTTTSAILGGNITTDGGSSVTDRGVCWGTSPNPVVGGNHAHVGTGLGTFSYSLTGLSYGTYHFRAWATNSTGTSYGTDRTFTLLAYQIIVAP